MFLLKFSWNRNRNYLEPVPLFFFIKELEPNRNRYLIFWRTGTGTDTDKFKRFQSLVQTLQENFEENGKS